MPNSGEIKHRKTLENNFLQIFWIHQFKSDNKDYSVHIN